MKKERDSDKKPSDSNPTPKEVISYDSPRTEIDMAAYGKVGGYELFPSVREAMRMDSEKNRDNAHKAATHLTDILRKALYDKNPEPFLEIGNIMRQIQEIDPENLPMNPYDFRLMITKFLTYEILYETGELPSQAVIRKECDERFNIKWTDKHPIPADGILARISRKPGAPPTKS